MNVNRFAMAISLLAFMVLVNVNRFAMAIVLLAFIVLISATLANNLELRNLSDVLNEHVTNVTLRDCAPGSENYGNGFDNPVTPVLATHRFP